MQATDATYNGGSFDVFVTKLGTAGGSLDFSTYLGGSSDDRGYGIAVNGATGRVYVAGQTELLGVPDNRGSVRHQLQRRLRCVRDEAGPGWLHPHQDGGARR